MRSVVTTVLSFLSAVGSFQWGRICLISKHTESLVACGLLHVEPGRSIKCVFCQLGKVKNEKREKVDQNHKNILKICCVVVRLKFLVACFCILVSWMRQVNVFSKYCLNLRGYRLIRGFR